MSLKDVGFDLAKGLRGLRRVGNWVGGWMDLFWEKNGSSEGEREDGYFPNNFSQWSLG